MGIIKMNKEFPLIKCSVEKETAAEVRRALVGWVLGDLVPFSVYSFLVSLLRFFIYLFFESWTETGTRG